MCISFNYENTYAVILSNILIYACWHGGVDYIVKYIAHMVKDVVDISTSGPFGITFIGLQGWLNYFANKVK